MIELLISLPAKTKRYLMIFFDSLFLISAFFLSFYLRLGYFGLPSDEILYLVLIAPFFGIPIFYFFGLYRFITRYITNKILRNFFYSVSLFILIIGLINFLIPLSGFPRSILIINWVITFIFIYGSRIVAQKILLIKDSKLYFRSKSSKKRVVIYGAGKAGIQLANVIEFSKTHLPVAFIDDNISLQGRNALDIKIYSPSEIHHLFKKYSFDEIIIAIPSLSNTERAEIINNLELSGVTIRTLPGLDEIAGGKIRISNVKDIDVIDLLGRPKSTPNSLLIKKNVSKKNILITGAGGSIGSELVRKIVIQNFNHLVVFDHSEIALYNIEKEILSLGINKAKFTSILGDVLNNKRLSEVLNKFSINTFFHAAAYKHVPIVEHNVSEGVRNNIFGTLSCMKALKNNNTVNSFVLISTDKAVRSTNIMGATKRVAEMIVQTNYQKKSSINYTIVRFGNVLGSSGSVIPLFKKQIENGGPITVTDAKVVRYFMTISEAVELVIQSSALSKNCETFLLDMGNPVRIDDLARKMISLSGHIEKTADNPKGDIEIKYIGLRPGEKLYEELLIDNASEKTEHPQILRAKEKLINWDDICISLENLKIALDENNVDEMINLLKDITGNYKPRGNSVDNLYRS